MARRTAVAAIVVLAIIATGCTPGAQWRGGDESRAPVDETISWRDCEDAVREDNPALQATLRIECGTIQVPRDWATAEDGKPSDGRTFDIALMRVRSTRQTDRIGSILVNPGGPGGSGIEYLTYATPDLSNLLARFDMIGFDPRGVGESSPVKCISDADLDASFGYEPDPVSDAAFQNALELSRRIADACGAKFGDDLRLFSTEQAARDMDAIRAALGEEKLNYLGYSYGTLLGAVYAQLFPQTIRAMVLDGAVDPQQGPVAGSEGQAKGFERAFTNFAAWCSDNEAECPIAPDARSAVINAIDSARTAPVRGAGGRQATAGWVFYAVVSTLYEQDVWPYLARGIADLRSGDPEFIFLLADSYARRDENGRYTNLFDANTAVNCVDGEHYPTVEEIRALQSDWRTTYPLFGAPLALGMLTCSLWPAKKDPYPVGPATGAPPIVVIGTTGDPATPYESTAKLAGLLGTGTVVTWEGEGHTIYPDPEAPCIDDAVESYMIELKPPPKDLVCSPR